MGFATESGSLSTVDNLMVSGSTTLNEVSIVNLLSVGNNLNIGTSSIDTTGSPLEIQSLGQQDINFMAGLVTIDTSGNLKVSGNLNVDGEVKAASTTTGKLNISGNETIGASAIPAGETEITIETTAVSSKSAIFVTPQSATDQPLGVISKVIGSSFTVGIVNPALVNIPFSWWIVGR